MFTKEHNVCIFIKARCYWVNQIPQAVIFLAGMNRLSSDAQSFPRTLNVLVRSHIPVIKQSLILWAFENWKLGHNSGDFIFESLVFFLSWMLRSFLSDKGERNFPSRGDMAEAPFLTVSISSMFCVPWNPGWYQERQLGDNMGRKWDKSSLYFTWRLSSASRVHPQNSLHISQWGHFCFDS